MNSEKICKGSLNVSEDVVIKIARAAAAEIDGVSLRKTAGCFISGKSPVEVKFVDSVLEISLEISLAPKINAVNAAQSVQIAVKESVQSMTGITVSKVNVRVVSLSAAK